MIGQIFKFYLKLKDNSCIILSWLEVSNQGNISDFN